MKNKLTSKIIAAGFSVAAGFSGFLFSSKNITGNAISNSTTINALSIIGLVLMVCSILLAYYALKKE